MGLRESEHVSLCQRAVAQLFLSDSVQYHWYGDVHNAECCRDIWGLVLAKLQYLDHNRSDRDRRIAPAAPPARRARAVTCSAGRTF